MKHYTKEGYNIKQEKIDNAIKAGLDIEVLVLGESWQKVTVLENINISNWNYRVVTPPLFNLKYGDIITDGLSEWLWLGPQMGTAGCWRVNYV